MFLCFLETVMCVEDMLLLSWCGFGCSGGKYSVCVVCSIEAVECVLVLLFPRDEFLLSEMSLKNHPQVTDLVYLET